MRRYEITRPVDLTRLGREIQQALALPEPPPLVGRNPADGNAGVVGVPDLLDPAVVAQVIEAQPDAETVARGEAANESTVRQQATTALQANRDFLALASPTNAQTLAQVKALTRQNNGLIRLVLNRLDGTD